MSVTLKLANLSLLILFPIAWLAPLLRAGLLPLFSLDEISTITALQSLWEKDVFLALIVTFFALFAPVIKVAGTALVQFEFLSGKALSTIEILGKLSMADVFLVAIYIVVAKGVGIGRIETGWGLYLFTACVLGSMTITHITKRQLS
ncbi:MAG: paraquat-inducible protein A [Paracoccaceae bacterium]